MLSTAALVLYKTPNRTWDMNKELEGWEMGSRLELLPFVDDDVDGNSDECCSLGPLGVAVMHRVSVSSSCSSTRKEAVSNVKKKSAISKRAMTERQERWLPKGVVKQTKSHWRQLVGIEVGQNSHDKWRSTEPKASGKRSLPRWMRLSQP